MIKERKPNGYWTKELCQIESLKYNIKNDYRKNNNASFIAAKRNKWIDEICSHMISPYKPNTYWTYDKCKEEALKYQSRTKFGKKSFGAYKSAKENNWLNEICSHMTQFRSEYSGYAYEFEDNHFYVGITSREKSRKRAHSKLENSAVFRYAKLTGLKPKLIILFPPTNPHEAAKLEGWWENDYINRGWIKLNIAHTGSLGGNMVIWTKEKCQEEALKYNTRTEFQNKCISACGAARKNKWMDEICSHMIRQVKPNGYWTKEKCQEVALRCKTKNEFRKKYKSAYGSSIKNGWFNEICSCMISPQKPTGYWTKDRCQEESLKYKSKVEFSKNSGSAYNKSYCNGWLDEICLHMNKTRKPFSYWTKEKCQEITLKYQSKTELIKNNSDCYHILLKNDWIDEMCFHMVELKKPSGYWTKEKCKQEAIKYNHRSEFQKKSKSAYTTARNNEWVDDICFHMTLKIKPNRYWNKETCKQESLKVKSRSEFNDKCSTAYCVSRKNGWLDEFFPKKLVK